MEKLIHLPAAKNNSTDLRRLVDATVNCVDCLSTTGHFTLEAFISSLVYSKLPYKLQIDWDDDQPADNKVLPYPKLLEYVTKKAFTLSDHKSSTPTASSTTAPEKKPVRRQDQAQSYSKPQKSHVYSVSSPTPSPTSYKWDCVLCQPEKHPLHICPKWLGFSVDQRLTQVKDRKLCANCLAVGHATSVCKSSYRCRDCGQAHHTTIHKSSPPSVQVSSLQSQSQQLPDALLMTAEVLLKGPGVQQLKARAFLDPGAGLSLISSRVAQILELPLESSRTSFTTVQGTKCQGSKYLTTVNISPLHNQKNFQCRPAVVQTVTEKMPNKLLAPVHDFPHLLGLQLADTTFNIPGRVDILLGADIWLQLQGQSPPITASASEPGAQDTVFGWVLAGPVKSPGPALQSIPTCHIQPAMSDETLHNLAHDYWMAEAAEEPELLLPLTEAQAEQHHPVYSVVKQSNTSISRRNSPAQQHIKTSTFQSGLQLEPPPQPLRTEELTVHYVVVCPPTECSPEPNLPKTPSASTPDNNIQKPICITHATQVPTMPTDLLTGGFTTQPSLQQASLALFSDSCIQPEEKTPLEPSGMISSSQLLMPTLQQTAAEDSEESSKDNPSGTILGETINPQQSEALHQDFRSNFSNGTFTLSKWKDKIPPVLQRPLTTLQKTGLGTTASLHNNSAPHFSNGAFSLSKWKDNLPPVLQRPFTTLQKTGLGEKLNSFTLTRLDMCNNFSLNNLTLINTVIFHPTTFLKTTAKDWHFWNHSSIHFSWLHDRNQQYLVTNYQSLSIMQATRSSTWISGITAASPKQPPEKGLLGKHSLIYIPPIPSAAEDFCNQPSAIPNDSPADTESHSILQDSGNAVLIVSNEPSSKKGVAAAATLDNTLKTLPSPGSDRTPSYAQPRQSATAIAVLPILFLHLAWHIIMLCLCIFNPTVAKNLLPTSYRYNQFFNQCIIMQPPYLTRAADHCCTQNTGLQTHQEPHPPPQPPPQPLVLGMSKEATVIKLSLIYRDKQHQATPTMASPGSMSRQEPSSPGQDTSSITAPARQPTADAAAMTKDLLSLHKPARRGAHTLSLAHQHLIHTYTLNPLSPFPLFRLKSPDLHLQKLPYKVIFMYACLSPFHQSHHSAQTPPIPFLML